MQKKKKSWCLIFSGVFPFIFFLHPFGSISQGKKTMQVDRLSVRQFFFIPRRLSIVSHRKAEANLNQYGRSQGNSSHRFK